MQFGPARLGVVEVSPGHDVHPANAGRLGNLTDPVPARGPALLGQDLGGVGLARPGCRLRADRPACDAVSQAAAP